MVKIRHSEKECKYIGGIGVPLKECKFEYITSPSGTPPDKDLFYKIIKSLPIQVMSKEHAEGPIKSNKGWHDYDPLEFIVRKMDTQLELHPYSDDIGEIKFNGIAPRNYSNAYSKAFFFEVRKGGIDEVVLYLTNYLK